MCLTFPSKQSRDQSQQKHESAYVPVNVGKNVIICKIHYLNTNLNRPRRISIPTV